MWLVSGMHIHTGKLILVGTLKLHVLRPPDLAYGEYVLRFAYQLCGIKYVHLPDIRYQVDLIH